MITEKEILEKYPKIFKDAGKSEMESCMHWGLEVPDSWLPIIDALCDAMQNYGYNSSDKRGTFKYPQVVADQVKQKFGELRFYYHMEYSGDGNTFPVDIGTGYRHYIDGMIAFAECLCHRINEEEYNKVPMHQ